MSEETKKSAIDSVNSIALLECLMTMIDNGVLLPDREFESEQSERWWYEDRDELLRKCRLWLKHSNKWLV